MTIILMIEELNPETFDIIIDEYLYNNSMLEDKSKPIKIEINFMFKNGLEAYPKFIYKLNNFNNSVLTKAEISFFLYLHYKFNDIEDDLIEYVLFSIEI